MNMPVKLSPQVVTLMLTEMSEQMSEAKTEREIDGIFAQFMRFANALELSIDTNENTLLSETMSLTPWPELMEEWSQAPWRNMDFMTFEEFESDDVYYDLVVDQIKAFKTSEGLFWIALTRADKIHLNYYCEKD
jgi:hypothetical protein